VMRSSVPARLEPGLNPNQPNARMNVPSIAMGMLVRSNRVNQLARFVVFTVARSNQPGEDERNHAALHVHHRRAGEVHVTVARIPALETGRISWSKPSPTIKRSIHRLS
jgi:hypothetical protein